MDWFRRLRRGGIVAAAVLALAACSVKFVSDYDEQIDGGLTQFNTDLTAFVEKMIAAADTPAGTYASNQDFYSQQDARLSSLVVRAEAHKVLGSCPPAALVAGALKVADSNGKLSTPTGPLPLPGVNSIISQIKDDDCSVVLLSQIRSGLGDLGRFHQAQGAKGIPALARDPILVGGLGSLVRAGMVVEIAKKSGGKVGG